MYQPNEHIFHQVVRIFGNTPLSLQRNSFEHWSRIIYTCLAVEERVPLAWLITRINIVTVSCFTCLEYRKNDLVLIMTPEKQDKTLELSKHCSADSMPARNEVIMKTTCPVKSVKCDKICSNY